MRGAAVSKEVKLRGVPNVTLLGSATGKAQAGSKKWSHKVRAVRNLSRSLWRLRRKRGMATAERAEGQK